MFTHLGELREMNTSHDASGKGRGKGHIRRKRKNKELLELQRMFMKALPSIPPHPKNSTSVSAQELIPVMFLLYFK